MNDNSEDKVSAPLGGEKAVREAEREGKTALSIEFNTEGLSPDGKALLDHIKNGDVAAVERMLRDGALERQDIGFAFGWAAINAQGAILKRLAPLLDGADTQSRDRALVWSAMGGAEESVRFLVEDGAGLYGLNQALIISATAGRAEIAEFLLDSGAEIGALKSSFAAGIASEELIERLDSHAKKLLLREKNENDRLRGRIRAHSAPRKFKR